MFDKKGVSQVVTVVLIISLVLSAVGVLWGTIHIMLKKSSDRQSIDSFRETIGLQESELEKANLEAGDGGCVADWDCGKWLDCEVVYNLDGIIEGGVFLEGERERKCDDLNGCFALKFEKEKCITKAPVNVEKVVKCSREYLEVRDDEGTLISRIELSGETEVLNLQFFLGEVEYCFYCYDGIKDYDEDGVDCVYAGESCPIC